MLFQTQSGLINYQALGFTIWRGQQPAGGAVISAGGLHHIGQGMGDPGVGVVPQTLQTIENGIAA